MDCGMMDSAVCRHLSCICRAYGAYGQTLPFIILLFLGFTRAGAGKCFVFGNITPRMGRVYEAYAAVICSLICRGKGDNHGRITPFSCLRMARFFKGPRC